MRAAQIMFVFCLFGAAAAMGCDGDPSCAVETDAAVLLQSATVLQVEEATGTQASLSDRRRRRRRRRGSSSPSQATSSCSGTVESDCPSTCSWAGEECKAQCSSFNGDKTGCVASGYCAWRGMNANSGTCIEYIGSVDLGGTDSGMKYQAGAPVAQRPELLKREHYDGSTWASCSGTTNCWYGYEPSPSWRYDDMRVNLGGSSSYSKAAIEFLVKCKTGADSNIKVSYKENDRSDAAVQVWYNLIDKIDDSTSSSGWPGQGNSKELTIPISSDDANPVFRMEVSKLSSGTTASLEAQITVNNVKAWFDSCMEQKQAHSQCMQVFAAGNQDLRSDNAKQLACLDGSTTSASCTAWKNCLDLTPGGADTKTTLKNVIKAFDNLALMQVQQETISKSKWTAGTNCAGGAYPACEDLSRLDVPAFSCTCYNDLVGKTPGQIRQLACPKKAMCCSWKESNCNDASTYTLTGSIPGQFLQVDDQEDSGKTMLNRSEQASLAQEVTEEASLDESLSGKRC